jgi:hypothetical protein
MLHALSREGFENSQSPGFKPIHLPADLPVSASQRTPNTRDFKRKTLAKAAD